MGGIAIFSACTPDDTERITAEPGIVDAPNTTNQPATPAPEQYEINTVVEELTNAGSFEILTWAIEATGLIYPIDQVLLPPEFVEQWNLS